MDQDRIPVPNAKHPSEMTEKERIRWYRSIAGLRALEQDFSFWTWGRYPTRDGAT